MPCSGVGIGIVGECFWFWSRFCVRCSAVSKSFLQRRQGLSLLLLVWVVICQISGSSGVCF